MLFILIKCLDSIQNYVENVLINRTVFCQNEAEDQLKTWSNAEQTSRSFLVSTMACSLHQSFKKDNVSEENQEAFLKPYLMASLWKFCNESSECENSPFESSFCNLAEFLFLNKENKLREDVCKDIGNF